MMTRETILNKVKEAFTSVLEHKNFTLTNETTADDVDGWESITVGDLLDTIESELQLKSI